MQENQNYHPVGLMLAEKRLFGQPLAKKDFSANSWPKNPSSANTCSTVLENSYQLGFLVFYLIRFALD